MNQRGLRGVVRILIALIGFMILFFISTFLYSTRYWHDIYSYFHPVITIKHIHKLSDDFNLTVYTFVNVSEEYSTTESYLDYDISTVNDLLTHDVKARSLLEDEEDLFIMYKPRDTDELEGAEQDENNDEISVTTESFHNGFDAALANQGSEQDIAQQLNETSYLIDLSNATRQLVLSLLRAQGGGQDVAPALDMPALTYSGDDTRRTQDEELNSTFGLINAPSATDNDGSDPMQEQAEEKINSSRSYEVINDMFEIKMQESPEEILDWSNGIDTTALLNAANATRQLALELINAIAKGRENGELDSPTYFTKASEDKTEGSEEGAGNRLMQINHLMKAANLTRHLALSLIGSHVEGIMNDKTIEPDDEEITETPEEYVVRQLHETGQLIEAANITRQLAMNFVGPKGGDDLVETPENYKDRNSSKQFIENSLQEISDFISAANATKALAYHLVGPSGNATALDKLSLDEQDDNIEPDAVATNSTLKEISILMKMANATRHFAMTLLGSRDLETVEDPAVLFQEQGTNSTKFWRNRDCKKKRSLSSAEGVLSWMVAIYVKNSTTYQFEYSCSGIILSDKTILTAAHCLSSEAYPVYPGDVLVVTGKRQLHQVDTYTKLYKVQTIKLHGGFVSSNTATDDLALLHTEEAMELGEFAQPACLVNDGLVDDLAEAPGVGTSWTSEENITLSETLTLTKQKIVLEGCGGVNTFCTAMDKASSLSCPPVGAAYASQPPGTDSWLLRGVLSGAGQTCPPSGYLVYTDLLHYTSWIEDNTLF